MNYQPKFPIYVISKGRHDRCLTANFLIQDGIDFKIVVEPQEAEAYSKRYGNDRILILPFSNLGLGSIPARNWVWEHSLGLGAERHWILDDNIRRVRRLFKGKRIPCNSKIAFACLEEFVGRYENIALAGLNYTMFVLNDTPAPFYLNCHVYSFFLIWNKIPYRWRGRYNEDTDLCLQVLSGGLCTVLLNAFMCDKMTTMTMRGGNTDDLYRGDGRLKMARSLERVWPGVVSTDRRFQRPQHIVKGSWRNFDTSLIRKNGLNWDEIKASEKPMNLVKVRKIKSNNLSRFIDFES